MTDTFDLIIIGAGPAGMAAAELAAKHGASILILDEQARPGGQIYRAVEIMANRNRVELGDSYHAGLTLVNAFRDSHVQYIPKASVWQVSQGGEVGYSFDGTAHIVIGKQVIIATGAQERPFPIPGWTLSGVMTMGAAQILLKESELAIEDAVFAGCGPLFYLVIHQYLTAGIPIKAVIDLTPKGNYLKALPHLFSALPALPKIYEGWKWKREIIKSNVPYFSDVSDLKILGEEGVTGISYKQGSTWKTLDASHILLHQGVVPNVNISLAAGCKSSWNEDQACWRINVDDWFQSSVKGVRVTGDGASIGGALAAEQRGRIAAVGALVQLEKITATEGDHLAAPYKAALAAEMRVRPFLDALFKPSDTFRIPQHDNTIVCRCEEVTVGQVRQVVGMGCAGPNQLKSFSRCGMGPCQGRFCGLTVSELISETLKKPVSAVGYYRLRPPVKPLLLQELANLKITKGDSL
ncbi:NAD(P)/FAD-dependent oxidoreductase [Marinomonas transparens]|uniref:FAD-dependent oxidoreductase n=1 Tax=Marinomonas transparens TaxID=2795388 RepID=A0A934N629_9GAMM|nr:NAD(P)/FAD-dependent oxidoreductase [Marinomonas transparens]MBJ7537656.1 FAD-dependent oxidoreductase [Marinomonas transparens]